MTFSLQHAARTRPRQQGFTLIELLVCVAIIATLLSILLPGLARARAQAWQTVCTSNIRQLAIANGQYAIENAGRYCPGAADMRTTNTHRWHGVRESGGAFDPRRGPLIDYLSGETRIRACPSADFAATPHAFELGGGGYGYNHQYLGRVLRPSTRGRMRVVTDLLGANSSHVRRPAETMMFADAAFATLADGVTEYSFAEPRYHPEYPFARMDPSVHFRHNGRASVAWVDGHVDARRRTFTWKSGLYPGDPDPLQIGWFGLTDNNRLFDYE